MSDPANGFGKQEDKTESFEARRIDILRRAAIVFADEGFHQTSVNSLAESLGVSKPVLYYYAQNKDDLLHQISQIALDEMKQATLEAVHSNLSGLGKIRRFFAIYAGIMGSDFGRCYVLVDARGLDRELREKELGKRRELEMLIREMLEQGKQDGSIRNCDTAVTARLLFGTFNGIPHWFRPEGPLSIADITEIYLDTLLVGIARK